MVDIQTAVVSANYSEYVSEVCKWWVVSLKPTLLLREFFFSKNAYLMIPSLIVVNWSIILSLWTDIIGSIKFTVSGTTYI